MGMLVYNGRMTLHIDDRVLAHLQVVVINKLRRRESFTFTWDDGAEEAVCWIGPSIPLEFTYSGNRRPLLNREWLELMAMSANANSGLVGIHRMYYAARSANTRRSPSGAERLRR